MDSSWIDFIEDVLDTLDAHEEGWCIAEHTAEGIVILTSPDGFRVTLTYAELEASASALILRKLERAREAELLGASMAGGLR